MSFDDGGVVQSCFIVRMESSGNVQYPVIVTKNSDFNKFEYINFLGLQAMCIVGSLKALLAMGKIMFENADH